MERAPSDASQREMNGIKHDMHRIGKLEETNKDLTPQARTPAVKAEGETVYGCPVFVLPGVKRSETYDDRQALTLMVIVR